MVLHRPVHLRQALERGTSAAPCPVDCVRKWCLWRHPSRSTFATCQPASDAWRTPFGAQPRFGARIRGRGALPRRSTWMPTSRPVTRCWLACRSEPAGLLRRASPNRSTKRELSVSDDQTRDTTTEQFSPKKSHLSASSFAMDAHHSCSVPSRPADNCRVDDACSCAFVRRASQQSRRLCRRSAVVERGEYPVA